MAQVQMDDLEVELQTVLDGLTMFLAAPGDMRRAKTNVTAASAVSIAARLGATPYDVTTGINVQKTRKLLDTLEPLLKNGNPECLNFSDELRLIPGSGELIQQMEDSYFGEAEITLAEMRKKWKL